MTDEAPIVLFDGVCNLCNGTVNFILDHDPAGRFRFAALQSEAGRALLVRHGLAADALESLVLVEGERAWVRSDAALRIAAGLGAPWRWLAVLRVVPRGIRDRLYDAVARNRYRWFGRRDECRVPTPDLRARFL